MWDEEIVGRRKSSGEAQVSALKLRLGIGVLVPAVANQLARRVLPALVAPSVPAYGETMRLLFVPFPALLSYGSRLVQRPNPAEVCPLQYHFKPSSCFAGGREGFFRCLLTSALAVTFVLALAACEGKKAQPDNSLAPVASTGQPPASSRAAPPKPAAKKKPAPTKEDAAAEPKEGLAAPGNDPEVVEQVRKVRDGCKWGRNDFAGACKPFQDWIQWAGFPGRDDILPTLVAVLEDESAAVRHVAAVGLEVIGTRPRSDKKIGTALFDAFEKERNPKNCRGIAMQAANFKLEKIGLDERAKKLAKAHPLVECRAQFVDEFLQYNPQHYDMVVELAKTDKDLKVRVAALAAMREGARKNAQRERNNCKVWQAQLLDETQPAAITARTVELLGGTGGVRASGTPCTSEWDQMLTRVEAMAAAGKAQSTKIPFGLCEMLEQRKATSEQKTKTLSIAKKIVENNANGEASRFSALNCVARHDPAAKAFAKAFEQDDSEKVKKEAKRILTAKPK